MVLGAVLYIAGFIFVSNGNDLFDAIPVFGLAAFIGWNAALVTVTTLVIIDSVKRVRKGMTVQFATDVFVVKLAAIPFFVINFAIFALLGLVGSVIIVRGGMFLLAATAIAAGFTFISMLSTSVYGWASIVHFRREGRMGTARAVIYSLLLLVFVADTVVGILLFVESRRAMKAGDPAAFASIEALT